MVHAWGGYSNGQIPLSAMIAVQGNNYFEPDMAARMNYLLNTCSAQGVNIHINEGYRPLGAPADRYVTVESQTSTGGSNQYFQLGRMDRGETPSAGTPGTSSHGWALAADINPGRGNATVASVCAQLGLIFTVASEAWHVAADGTPSIPYPSLTKKRKKNMFIVNNGSAEFVIGQEYIHHVSGPAEEASLIPILGDVIWKGGADFTNILKAFGIPADKPAAVMGGKTWSLTHDTYAIVAPKSSSIPLKK